MERTEDSKFDEEGPGNVQVGTFIVKLSSRFTHGNLETSY